MYFDRRGNGQNHPRNPDKTFQTKDPLIKPPDKNPREQLRENGVFVLVFCTRPTNNGGGFEMCDSLLGCPGMCDKVRQGRGSKLAKNSVTYFMDDPKPMMHIAYSTPKFSKIYKF